MPGGKSLKRVNWNRVLTLWKLRDLIDDFGYIEVELAKSLCLYIGFCITCLDMHLFLAAQSLAFPSCLV